MTTPQFNRETVDSALADIFGSRDFVRADRLKKFLNFVVDYHFENPEKTLVSKTLTVDCFGRDLNTDPDNTYVRNVASKTRKALKDYYQTLDTPPPLLLNIASKGYRLELTVPASLSAAEIEIIEGLAPISAKAQPSSPSKLLPVVAVLPFQCLAGEQQHSILGTMISDSLITNLAKSTQLRTISRRSTAQLYDNHRSTAELGQLLDADYLIEGRFTVYRGKLQLHLELSDCTSNEIVWADRFNSPIESLLAESDDLVDKALVGISDSLLQHELQRVHSTPLSSLQCHTLFLGSTNIMHRNSPVEFARAKELLETLVRRNPRHPTPLAYLAYWGLLRLFRDSAKEHLMANIEFLQQQLHQALQIDSQHPIALTASASTEFYFKGDQFSAQSQLERALHHAPNEPAAMYRLAACQLFSDSATSSYEQATKTLTTSPLDPELYYFHMAAALAAASNEDYQMAIQHAERSYKIFPDHPANLRVLVAAHTAAENKAQQARFSSEHRRLEPNFKFENYRRELPLSDHPAIQNVLALIEKSGLEATGS